MTKAQEKKLLATRGQQLEALGLTQDNANGYSKEGVTVAYEAILTHTAETWEQLIAQLSQAKEQPQESKELSIVAFKDEPTSLQLLKDYQGQLSAKVTEAKALTVTSLADKDTYKAIAKLKSEIRKLRTTTEAKRKEVKAYYLEVGRAIDSRAKECFDIIEPGESHLDAEIAKWDSWESAEKLRIEQEKTAERDRRVKLLTEAGITFNGISYSIGDINFDLFTIEALTPEQLTDLLTKVQATKLRLDTEATEKAEREQKEREEAEKQKQEVERQKQENERRERELAAKVTAMRKKELKFAGLVANSFEDIFSFRNDFIEVEITIARVNIWGDEEFESYITTTTEAISAAKVKQNEKDTRVQTRIKQLVSLGYVPTSFNAYWYAAIMETIIYNVAIETFDNENWDTIININNKVVKASIQYEGRVKELQGLGLSFIDDAYEIVIPGCVSGVLRVPTEQIKYIVNEGWHNVIADVKAFISKKTQEAEQAKADAEFKQRQQEQEYQRRITQLLGLGLQTNASHLYFNYNGVNYPQLYYSFSFIKSISSENWDAQYADIKHSIELTKQKADEEVARIAAEKEAAKPEIEKIREYVQAIMDVKIPCVEVGENILTQFTKTIELAARQAMNDLDKI